MQQNKRLITISMLSAIAFVLTFIKFPIPFLPPYLTLDFSDVPSLLATFTFGPVAGIVVALVKNLLNYLFSMGDPVGPFANFLAGASFLLTAYAIYKNKRSTKSLITGLIIATIVMTIVLSILNYFVLLPLYGMIFNLADIANNLKVIIYQELYHSILLLKSIVISIVFILLYRRLANFLKRI
ncbi:ECF transporter S component [Staphylococcus aureus]